MAAVACSEQPAFIGSVLEELGKCHPLYPPNDVFRYYVTV